MGIWLKKLDICLVRTNHCEGCAMGEQHRCTSYRATEPFELIHSDMCGPMSESSIGGSHYHATFIDDFARYTVVYFRVIFEK